VMIGSPLVVVNPVDVRDCVQGPAFVVFVVFVVFRWSEGSWRSKP